MLKIHRNIVTKTLNNVTDKIVANDDKYCWAEE